MSLCGSELSRFEWKSLSSALTADLQGSAPLSPSDLHSAQELVHVILAHMPAFHDLYFQALTTAGGNEDLNVQWEQFLTILKFLRVAAASSHLVSSLSAAGLPGHILLLLRRGEGRSFFAQLLDDDSDGIAAADEAACEQLLPPAHVGMCRASAATRLLLQVLTNYTSGEREALSGGALQRQEWVRVCLLVAAGGDDACLVTPDFLLPEAYKPKGHLRDLITLAAEVTPCALPILLHMISNVVAPWAGMSESERASRAQACRLFFEDVDLWRRAASVSMHAASTSEEDSNAASMEWLSTLLTHAVAYDVVRYALVGDCTTTAAAPTRLDTGVELGSCAPPDWLLAPENHIALRLLRANGEDSALALGNNDLIRLMALCAGTATGPGAVTEPQCSALTDALALLADHVVTEQETPRTSCSGDVPDVVVSTPHGWVGLVSVLVEVMYASRVAVKNTPGCLSAVLRLVAVLATAFPEVRAALLAPGVATHTIPVTADVAATPLAASPAPAPLSATTAAVPLSSSVAEGSSVVSDTPTVAMSVPAHGTPVPAQTQASRLLALAQLSMLEPMAEQWAIVLVRALSLGQGLRGVGVASAEVLAAATEISAAATSATGGGGLTKLSASLQSAHAPTDA